MLVFHTFHSIARSSKAHKTESMTATYQSYYTAAGTCMWPLSTINTAKNTNTLALKIPYQPDIFVNMRHCTAEV